MNKKLLVIFMMLFCKFSQVNAQGTAGKEFWVAFMAQDWGCYYNQYWNNSDTAQLFLSSQCKATVSITAPGQNFSKTVTLVPNETKMVELPPQVVCRYSDSVTTNGVHVVSDSTINVYAVNRYWFSKGATVVLPVTSIVPAPEYFITTNDDTYNWGWYCNGKSLQSPEFTIVGIADSSVIEIVPTGASSRNSPAGVPFQIKLKQGETFQYMTTDRDLTGSIVRAKYPMSKFSVFAGNRQTYFYRNVTNQGLCYSSWDHDYEQMLPTVTWGSEYTAMPFKKSGKGYVLKIVAAENNTVVNINGSWAATLQQGKFYTYSVDYDTVTRVTSNNKISVGQFATGGYYCTGNNNSYNPLGDPAQVQLFPDVQMGNAATVNTVSETNWWWWGGNWWNSYLPEHYINVMARSQDTSYFKLNYKGLPNNLWKADPNLNGFHYAQLKIDSGSHYMSSSKGFLSYVYGYGRYEGYAYAAAANFKPIQNNFLIVNAQCKRDTVEFNAILTDSFSNYRWVFGDGSTDTGAKVKHKYQDTGWYTVKMYCNHIITNDLDSVTKSLYVADTKIKSLFGSDTLICGKVDLVVISKGFNVDNEYRWNDNHNVYYKAIKKAGTYWLEVKERNGCVLRDSLIIANGAYPHASVSVNYDQFCMNRSKNVVFSNHSTSKDSIDFYQWDFGGVMKYTKDTTTKLTYDFKKADVYYIVVRAQTKLGCYDDTFAVVDVLASPKANFTFTTKDTCFNTNKIELKNNTVINKNDHKRFKWYFSEGFNLSNNNPSGPRTYSNPGNYKVYLIYENNNGCIDTMVQNVSIIPNPDANFTTPNSVYCTLDTMPLYGNASTSAFKPLTYKWLFPDKTTSSDSVPRKAFTSTGNTTVKLWVTNPQGCKDSFFKTIQVNEKPKVDFTVNKDTQCFYQHRFDFGNITKFGGGSLNYTWNITNGFTSTDSNLSNITFAKDSVYKVKLSTTTSVGCYAEKIRNVYLGAYPVADFSIPNDQQCYKNNRFNFNQNFKIKNAVMSDYEWRFGNGDTAHRANVANYRYNKEDTFYVTVIGKSSLGCKDTAVKRVVVYPQSKSLFSVNNNIQCSKQQKFVLTNQSTLKSGWMTYQWSFGDNKTSTDTHAVKQYASPGQYTVRLIVNSDHNCADTSTQLLTVNVSPNSVFTTDVDKQCFKGNVFNFKGNSNISSGSIASQKWLMGDGNTFTTQDVNNYSYNSEDTFKVRLITVSDKNCSDTVTHNVITFAQPVILFDIPNDTQCWQKNHFVIQNKTKLKYGTLTNAWTFGDNTSSTLYDPRNKVYPNASASYLVTYKAVSDHGCKDSAQRKITLLERPVAGFGINDSIQCFNGHNFTFTNQTSFSVMNTLSYWWTYDNGNNSTGFTPQSATYSKPGIYKVKLITNSTLTNCYDTMIKPVVAAPYAQADFNLVKDMLCFRGHDFKTVNNSKVEFGTMSYDWNFGDNTTSSDTAPDKKYAVEKSYNIRLVVNTNYNCPDTLIRAVDFYPTPKSAFSINDTAQCLNGHAFDFTNTTTLASGNLTQEWFMDDNTSSVNKDVSAKVFSTPGMHKIRLASLSDQGCTDTFYREVYLEGVRNSEILLSGNDSQCLKGNVFDFRQSLLNSQVLITSYKWLMGDGQELNGQDPAAMSYKQDGPYQVQLVTVSANNCQDTLVMPVLVHPHPVSAFTAQDVCFPEPVVFTNSSTIKSGNISKYKWEFGDGGNSAQKAPSHKYALEGVYNVKLITESEFGCKDTLLTYSAARVKAKPTAEFDFSALPILKPNETRLQFRNLSSPNAVAYRWDFGNNTGSTDKDPVGEYGDTGTYWITLITTSTEGCTDTFKMFSGQLIPDFAYFLPNAFSPGNGDGHNDEYKGFATTYAYKFKMEIFNRWGEKLWETDDITKGWDGKYQGEMCMDGVYMVRVQIVPFKGYMRVYEQQIILLR